MPFDRPWFYFIAVIFCGRTGKALGGLYPDVFLDLRQLVVIATLSLAVFPAHKQCTPHRITSFLVLDVIALLLLIHAMAAWIQGFAYLLLVIVAISSIFFMRQTDGHCSPW